MSPDIMLLPRIAVLYRTSIDSLFNMESVWDEDHQKEFEAKIEAYYNVKDYESAYRAWITEIERNPDNFSYYVRVMNMVFFEKLLDDTRIERMLMLADHAEKYCFDTDIKNEIYLQMLMICANSESGRFKEESLNYYNKLPRLRHSRELLEYMIADKGNQNNLIKKNIVILVDQLEWEVRRLITPEQPAEKQLLYYKKAEEILLFVVGGGYGGLLDGHLLLVYSNMIWILTALNREAEAESYIKKVCAIFEKHIDETAKNNRDILYEDVLPYKAEGILKVGKEFLRRLKTVSCFAEYGEKLSFLIERYESIHCKHHEVL